MSVVSLSDYVPPARYDEPIPLPWTAAQIGESATQDGPFTTIDTLTFATPDPDPTKPGPRNLTTVNATLPQGWYLVTFLDAAGHPFVTSPVEYPPATDVLDGSAIVTLEQLKIMLGITKSTSDVALTGIINGVSYVVSRLTAKSFTARPASPSDSPVSVSVPVGMPPPPRSLLWGPASFGTPLGSIATAQEWPITIPHASEIDSLSLDTTGVLEAGQYILEPDHTLQDSLWTPYWRRVVIIDPGALPAQTLTVTGRFGIVPAPEDLADVILAMCARRYKERDASWGDSVQLPDGGLISYYRSLPPWVRLVIDSYCEVSM